MTINQQWLMYFYTCTHKSY